MRIQRTKSWPCSSRAAGATFSGNARWHVNLAPTVIARSIASRAQSALQATGLAPFDLTRRSSRNLDSDEQAERPGREFLQDNAPVVVVPCRGRGMPFPIAIPVPTAHDEIRAQLKASIEDLITTLESSPHRYADETPVNPWLLRDVDEEGPIYRINPDALQACQVISDTAHDGASILRFPQVCDLGPDERSRSWAGVGRRKGPALA